MARRLDALATFIATPITTRRGLLARLHYLTRTERALEKIESAYRTVRRQNVARYLLVRLTREGRGRGSSSSRSTKARCPAPANGPWSSAL